MVGAAGLTLRRRVGVASRDAAALAGSGPARRLSPWVTIATDGTIAIMSPATEMGQGSTDLAAADHRRGARRRLGQGADRAGAADRGDSTAIRVSAVRCTPPARNAVTSYYQAAAPVRRAGAPSAARRTPRKQLGRPGRRADDRTEHGDAREVRAASLSYGEIAAFAEMPAKAPEIKPRAAQETERVPPDRQGRHARRAAGARSTAAPSTRSTCRCPACSTARSCARRSRAAARTRSTKPRRRRSSGVVRIVPLPYGVGVIAETPWAALRGAPMRSTVVTWTAHRQGLGLRQRQGHGSLRRGARNLDSPAKDWGKAGRRAWPRCSKAATVVEAEYRCDYAYHAQMEPLNAVASVSPDGDACEMWCGTQSQTHGGRGDRQGARHPARQGQAPRHADGRRLRPARPSRRGIHRRRGAAVEGGEQAGQGDVDARGRRPQRPLPADVRASPARRASTPRAS